ncbi:CBS domain-containing protein [Thermobrachium celere]|uniref:CBS domain-containing protein n=1 Tax=Thermobrachium celere TaxID=53422 RepID=UPI001A4A65D2|nr:CBS domain-containing protein [Thermobrachium celere]GFR34848.1 hypothetical protein TCEA9_06600 [Thermobrachium celere]
MWFIDLIYKVRDIMDTNVVLLHKDTTLGETIDIMFKNRREEVLIVDDRKDLIGIFTKMDIPTQDNLDRIRNKKICEFMQKNVITISPDDNVRDARNLMLRLNIGRLPVIEGNKVIGILTATNIRDKFYLRIDELFGFQKNILENLHEAVCIINKKGVVIYWNKSAEKLYNISAAEILGKNISEIFPDALILKALKGEKIENVYHKPTKDKTVILSVVPIYNTNNEVIAAVSTDRDVTEVVNLSVQLENEKKKVEFLKSQYNKEIAEKFSFSSIYGKSKKNTRCDINSKKSSKFKC